MITTYLGMNVRFENINLSLYDESNINTNTYTTFRNEFFLLWRNKFLESK